MDTWHIRVTMRRMRRDARVEMPAARPDVDTGETTFFTRPESAWFRAVSRGL